MTTCVYETDVLFSESTLSYLLEAGPEVKQSALSKMISKVKELLEKLKRFIQETVFRKRVKAVEDAVKKNPELGEKKVKVVDIDKKLKVEEEFVKDLKKAKTPADVERAKAKRKKALKIAAVAAAAITIAAGLLHIKNTRSRAKSLCDEYQKLLDLAEDKNKWVSSEYNDQYDIMKSATKTAASIIRSDMSDDSKFAGDNYALDRYTRRQGKLLDLRQSAGKKLNDLNDAYHIRAKRSALKKSYNPDDAENVKKYSRSKKQYEGQMELVRGIAKELNTSMIETMKSMSDVTEEYVKALQTI